MRLSDSIRVHKNHPFREFGSLEVPAAPAVRNILQVVHPNSSVQARLPEATIRWSLSQMLDFRWSEQFL
jgi:hypothetical protein